MDAVEAWCGMEDDDTLKEAFVADAREDLLEGVLARMTVEDEDDKNSSGDEQNQPVPRPPGSTQRRSSRLR